MTWTMKEIKVMLNEDIPEEEMDDYISKLRKINQAIYFFEWCQKRHPEILKEYLNRYK